MCRCVGVYLYVSIESKVGVNKKKGNDSLRIDMKNCHGKYHI